MTATLHLTPTNDAALEHLRAEVLALKTADALAPIHLLLPSARVSARLRDALGDAINIHFLQFYGLARAILNAAHTDHIHEIKDTAARRLVHHLLGELAAADQLTTFAPVWDKPGFTDVMLAWLREVKSQGIRPETVAAEAERTGSDRDRQLARIYAGYQEFLIARNLSDADGLLWLAAESLVAAPDCFRHAGPLFVYGFDQVNPMQLDLLANLTPRFAATHLYLLWDTARSESTLALTRLAGTRAALMDRLHPRENRLVAGAQPAAVTRLRTALFEQLPADQMAGNELVLIEAPSREEEVRTALRRIKALLLAGGTPDATALVAPHPAVYRRLVATVAEEYGVPVAVEGVLGTNPAVAALLNTLALSPDFPWRQTFDFLRSPYVDVSPWLDAEQVDLLDRLTRERPVIAGVEQWQHALQPLQLDRDADAEDEDRGVPPLVATLPRESLAAIARGLRGLFAHLTPPAEASHADYALWLQSALLGLLSEPGPEEEPPAAALSLHVVERCAAGPHAARDRAALALLLRTLRQLVTATDLIPPAGTAVAWPVFRTDLLNIVPAVPVYPPGDVARVRFDALESIRGLSPAHLFVLGLSEGEFPTPPAADVLYAPHDRRVSWLPLRRYTPGDDASLWWQVVSNAGRLTLLRPWLDDKGTPWPPSPYWQAVTDLFVGRQPEKMPVAAPLRTDAAASLEELSVALAATGAHQVPADLASVWALAAQGDTVLTCRAGRAAPGPYEGVLQAPDLLAELATRFGPDHVWSASRLNRFNNCPFGFFAEQLLELTPRRDPEEGLDARHRGSLLHAILEQLYRQLADESIAPTPVSVDYVLEKLDACCTAAWRDAPRRYGFRPGPLWQQEQAEMRRRLHALVRWECEENGEQPRFRPYQQELGFGIPGAPGPVRLVDDQGRAIRLRGIIDRIDRDEQGVLRIVDYKSGSSTNTRADLEQGRAVQTALYALAAEQLLAGATVAESVYLHIPSRKTSGKVDRSSANADDLLAAVVHAAIAAADHTRAGRFPNAPSKLAGQSLACATWCDLADLCRVTRRSVGKGRKLLADG